jgi:indole-3-glycerol phosphate synthase/phosphoribosylanthranilate isomerase
MADILPTIVEKRKADIKRLGITFGYDIPEKRLRPVHPFLTEKGVILEVKRASPSKGDIAPGLDAVATARSYAGAGAAAISCLTEGNYFKGSLKDLMEICQAVDIAVLRKDFLINEEEVEVAWRAGADAVLLIARILDSDMMVKMAKAAAAHKMTSLVEVRSEADIEKLRQLAAQVNLEYIVCGVNSRDLATFKIDLLKPCALLGKIRQVLGQNARVVFESGIRTPEAARFAGSLGFSGMLLGEAAAKAPELRECLVKSFLEAKPTKNSDFWTKYACHAELVTASPLIKICGLTLAEDVIYADSLGVDFVGFIFAAGFGRNVCGEKFEDIVIALKNIKAKKVAVITDPSSPEAVAAASYVEQGILDCLQLHGLSYEEVPERFLQLPHYFAITEKTGPLEEAAEKLFLMGEPRFLQDSKNQNYSTKHKLWLAGGVTAENVAKLSERFQPELIDLSSGVEDEIVGIKNHEKIKKIVTLLRLQ